MIAISRLYKIGSLFLVVAGAVGVSSRDTLAAKKPSTKSKHDPHLSVILAPGTNALEIGMSERYATLATFPCVVDSVSVGNKDVLMAVPHRDKPHLLVITAMYGAKLGNTSNITVTCEPGFMIDLHATIVPHEQAHRMVTFNYSAESDARVQEVISEERNKCTADIQRSLKDKEQDAALDAELNLQKGMMRRFAARDDKYFAREDFVVAKVFREVVVGTRGYVFFQIQNQTSGDFNLKHIALGDDSEAQSTTVQFPGPLVGAGDAKVGVVSFELPTAPKPITLQFVEDGPRRIKVTNIAM